MRIQLLSLLKLLLLGDEIALAVVILKLIAQLFGKIAPGDMSHVVFSKLPKRWKSPDGPMTETEMMDAINSGILFYRNVRRVLTH